MKASTQYTDLFGTAAADITDFGTRSNSLEDLSKKFGLDEAKLKLIGLTFYGIDKIRVKLICIDLVKSIPTKKHIVTISLPERANASLPNFFKRLDVVLYSKFDTESEHLELDAERSWSDYMDEEE
jgi:hypothetical protein